MVDCFKGFSNYVYTILGTTYSGLDNQINQAIGASVRNNRYTAR